MNHYKFIRNLGDGSSGTVNLYKHKSKRTLVAIKSIQINNSNKKSITRESKAFGILFNTPNVVRLIEEIQEERFIHIVLEYCKEGSLKMYLSSKKLKTPGKMTIICDILRSIKQIHSHNLVHRDLKLENFLITRGICKVADFGLARDVDNDLLLTCCGTPLNMAPEMFLSNHYTSKVDIWALGCMIYEILNGFHPFFAKNYNDLHELHGKPVNFQGLEPCQAEFINLALKTNPDERADLQRLINTSFIQNFLNNLYETLGNVFNDMKNDKNSVSINVCLGICIYVITDNLYNKEILEFETYFRDKVKVSTGNEMMTEIIDDTITFSEIFNEVNVRYSDILLYVSRRLRSIPDIDYVKKLFCYESRRD